jgi:hypothetical protein
LGAFLRSIFVFFILFVTSNSASAKVFHCTSAGKNQNKSCMLSLDLGFPSGSMPFSSSATGTFKGELATASGSEIDLYYAKALKNGSSLLFGFETTSVVFSPPPNYSLNGAGKATEIKLGYRGGNSKKFGWAAFAGQLQLHSITSIQNSMITLGSRSSVMFGGSASLGLLGVGRMTSQLQIDFAGLASGGSAMTLALAAQLPVKKVNLELAYCKKTYSYVDAESKYSQVTGLDGISLGIKY